MLSIQACALLPALRLRVRGRGGNPRQHLCAGGCIVSKPRFNHRTLHHIVLLHAVIGVRVGVVGAAPYSNPSCWKPIPSRPIHEKAVESVPPGFAVGLN